MKVSVDISPEYTEAYAIIYTNEMNKEIQDILNVFNSASTPIPALRNESDYVILKPEELYMIRIENGDTILYTKEQSYRSRKRLYEIKEQVGHAFMQINKSTLVNLSYMDSVQSSFSGTLLLTLKNGSSDYVSRKYLPAFKKYLGL